MRVKVWAGKAEENADSVRPGMQPDKLVASFEGDHDGKYEPTGEQGKSATG